MWTALTQKLIVSRFPLTSNASLDDLDNTTSITKYDFAGKEYSIYYKLIEYIKYLIYTQKNNLMS